MALSSKRIEIGIEIGSMTKKEHVMKVVDEYSGLTECLVCGAKHERGDEARC